MNPSATRANPEYAFSTVMTTAVQVSIILQHQSHIRISAPPMAEVVVYPFKKLSAVFAPKQVAAMAGDAGPMDRKAPIVNILPPSKLELITCRAGRILGLDDIRPASLRKATIDPVKVTPPTRLA